jgi:hypothetical protein
MIGPFLDETDGVTPITSLAGNGTEISKDGGAYATGPTLGTHDSEGMYPLALTTTHTNTVGLMLIKSFDATTHCPVFDWYEVIEEAVYDRDYAASALGYVANAPVNAAQVGGQTASAAGTVTFPGTIASSTNITSASGVSLSGTQTFNNTGTWTGNISGNVTGSVGSLTTNNDKTGYALSGTQTFNNTGTWTGNLSGSVGSVTATVSADVVSISGDGPAADNLERWFDGTVGFGTSGSVITGSLSGAVGSITGVTFPSNFSVLGINASGHVVLQDSSLVTAKLGTFVLAKTTNITGFNDIAATAVVVGGPIATSGGAVQITNLIVSLGDDSIEPGAFTTSTRDQMKTDTWGSTTTRTLTGGENIVLAKGTGVTGFNDLSAAQVNTEVDTGLADVGLTTTVTGRIDAAVSSRASAASLSTVDSNVSAILDDTGTSGVVLSAATCNKVADHGRRRTQANVFASSDGDAISKNSGYGQIQQGQKASISGTTLTVLNTDGSTLGTFTVTKDGTAEPLTGVS